VVAVSLYIWFFSILSDLDFPEGCGFRRER